MSLTEQLVSDMKTALKDKNKEKLSVIRMVRAAIKKIEIDKKASLNDEEVLEVFIREVKQRRDAIAEFKKADRNDLVLKEQGELAVLETYLPEQLSEDELRLIVQDTIEQTGASSKKEMGKVMGALKPKVRGKADGKLVSRLVQEYLPS